MNQSQIYIMKIVQKNIKFYLSWLKLVCMRDDKTETYASPFFIKASYYTDFHTYLQISCESTISMYICIYIPPCILMFYIFYISCILIYLVWYFITYIFLKLIYFLFLTKQFYNLYSLYASINAGHYSLCQNYTIRFLNNFKYQRIIHEKILTRSILK